MPTHEEVITGLRAERDALYADRNRVVQLAAALAQQLGQRVGVHTDPDEPDWSVLMIDLPGPGQHVSWHIARVDLLPGWDAYPDPWDGHTDQEKATRIRRYVSSPPPTGHEAMTDRTFLARVFHMAHHEGRLSALISLDPDDPDDFSPEEAAVRMAMMALMLAMYEVRDLQDDTIDATNPGRRIYKVVNSIHDDWERLSRSFDEMRVARGAAPWMARW